jgi:hypothetical protein
LATCSINAFGLAVISVMVSLNLLHKEATDLRGFARIIPKIIDLKSVKIRENPWRF